MDTSQSEKKPKTTAKNSILRGILSVTRDTRRNAVQLLSKINKKDFGRKVPMDNLISLALNLIVPEHIVTLQEASLSNSDRLERDYRAYVSQHGAISKDEYLGMRLTAGSIESGAKAKS